VKPPIEWPTKAAALRREWRVAEARQIDRDHAMARSECGQLLDPMRPASDQAMEEHQWRAFTEFDHIYRLTV
jgi:hypothetical protein